MSQSPPTVDRLLSLTAADLVCRLLDSGESMRKIEATTGIHRSQLSRWRSGERRAGEDDYRTLARLARAKKII